MSFNKNWIEDFEFFGWILQAVACYSLSQNFASRETNESIHIIVIGMAHPK